MISQASGIAILAIDDEPLMESVLRRVLVPAGFCVEFHLTTATALADPAALHEFQLLIVDRALLADEILPDGSGITLCRMLRGENYRYGGKIFMLSGLGDSDVRAFAIEAGADDYLVKPFHNREFIARIRRALGINEELIFGVVRLDPSGQGAWIENVYKWTPGLRYKLLELLVRRRGEEVSPEDINLKVHGGVRSESAARKLMHFLRQDIGCNEDLIVTAGESWRLLERRLKLPLKKKSDYRSTRAIKIRKPK